MSKKQAKAAARKAELRRFAVSGKELRRIAFQSVEERYMALRPLLKRVRVLWFSLTFHFRANSHHVAHAPRQLDELEKQQKELEERSGMADAKKKKKKKDREAIKRAKKLLKEREKAAASIM